MLSPVDLCELNSQLLYYMQRGPWNASNFAESHIVADCSTLTRSGTKSFRGATPWGWPRELVLGLVNILDCYRAGAYYNHSSLYVNCWRKSNQRRS